MAGWWHEQRTRDRAYAIWASEGRPDGKAEENWARAEAEIAEEEREREEEAKREAEDTL
jgi:hypothetical protein